MPMTSSVRRRCCKRPCPLKWKKKPRTWLPLWHYTHLVVCSRLESDQLSKMPHGGDHFLGSTAKWLVQKCSSVWLGPLTHRQDRFFSPLGRVGKVWCGSFGTRKTLRSEFSWLWIWRSRTCAFLCPNTYNSNNVCIFIYIYMNMCVCACVWFIHMCTNIYNTWQDGTSEWKRCIIYQ